VITLQALASSRNELAPHYSRFEVSERLLLTGHSHQAWPDRAEAGQLRAVADAAELVDRKWERAFEMADTVHRRFAGLLDDLDLNPALIDCDRSVELEGRAGFLALQSTHAGSIRSELEARGVRTDQRCDVLRFGPAPYLPDRQLSDAMAALGEAVMGLEAKTSAGNRSTSRSEKQ
jgi:hypothetical protein